MKKNKMILLVFSFLTAFVTLMICTKSSFLYPFNDWVDANAFFTAGKSMMHGKVDYRDIFEHKGVLLHFVHGLCYLISNTTFIGVFILEVIAGWVFFYYCAKTASLYVNEKLALVTLPLVAFVAYTSQAFAHGDSAEELCFPLLMYSIYYLLKHFKQKDNLNPKIFMTVGAMSACIIWVKFTQIGFWVAWMFVIFVSLLIQKQVKYAFLACAQFLVGMLIATAPWLIYFAVTNSIGDWIQTYFLVNANQYSGRIELSTVPRFAYETISGILKGKPVVMYIMGIGAAGFLLTEQYLLNWMSLRGVWARISLVFAIFMLACTVYIGGTYHDYYFLIFYPFVLLGFIVIVDMAYMLLRIFKRIILGKRIVKLKYVERVFIGVACLTLIFSAYGCYKKSPNVSFMKTSKQSLAQYKFADIMNKEPNPTLLNYGFLDGGFYTAADIVPSNKYFCKLNVTAPIADQTQNEMIRDKIVKYVVLRLYNGDNDGGMSIPFLYQNYNRISTVDQWFEGWHFDYVLFKVK